MTEESFSQRDPSRDRSTRSRRSGYGLVLAPALLWLLAFFVAPIVWLLVTIAATEKFTFALVSEVVLSPLYAIVFINSIKIALVTTIGSLVLGYPVAYFIATCPPRVRSYVILLVIFPLWINVVVRTYAFLIVLGRHGIFNVTLVSLGVIDEPAKIMYTTWAVYAGMIQVMLPFMILSITSAIQAIDPAVIRAARIAGANPLQAFARVLLPLSLPGVSGGCLLVFVLALGFFITPALLGGPRDLMIAQLIDQEVNGFGNFISGAILTFLLLVATLAIMAIYNRFLGLDRLWGGMSVERGRA